MFPFGILANDPNHDFKIRSGIITGENYDSSTSPLRAGGGGNSLTNREVLRALDPRINALPYVYDTFKWKHCAIDGYDLDDAWKDSTRSDSSKKYNGTASPPHL